MTDNNSNHIFGYEILHEKAYIWILETKNMRLSKYDDAIISKIDSRLFDIPTEYRAWYKNKLNDREILEEQFLAKHHAGYFTVWSLQNDDAKALKALDIGITEYRDSKIAEICNQIKKLSELANNFKNKFVENGEYICR